MRKLWGVVLVLVIAVGLATMLGGWIPPADLLAVVIGVLCGVAAGIPTAILILVVMTRWERQPSKPEPRAAKPTVIVIEPPTYEPWPPLQLSRRSLATGADREGVIIYNDRQP